MLNNAFLSILYMYPFKYFRLPLKISSRTPGVLLSQDEDHCSKAIIRAKPNVEQAKLCEDQSVCRLHPQRLSEWGTRLLRG
jgi:hypothetical protein